MPPLGGFGVCGEAERGCSSGVEHNLAKVGVEGSNPFARSSDRSHRPLHDRKLRVALGKLRWSGVHLFGSPYSGTTSSIADPEPAASTSLSCVAWKAQFPPGSSAQLNAGEPSSRRSE